MKTVISLIINDTQYFLHDSSFTFWTDHLIQAKIYNCKAHSKLKQIKSISGGRKPTIYLYVKGDWDMHNPVLLTEDILKTVKMHELLLEIKDL